MRTSREIRQEFIDFFTARGHAVVSSSSLLPANDPTLLFANAGMNQFKDVFLGTGTRTYTRAVNSQKCIRAGGKHNDLEDVGHDTYHHTFFEMLGNWSFGDYFKAEAIAWAWELLTKVWGLPKDKLWVTYFGGAGAGDSPQEHELWGKLQAAGVGPDQEVVELWRKTAGLPAERIVPGSVHDNFWAPGDTGPCGPCTEISYDFGSRGCDGHAHPGKACAVNVSGCERFIEIWNLVFIQFNRDESGVLAALPAKHVDTGMGFERVTRVLQGKASNYDTDIFAPLIRWLEQKSGVRYGAAAETDVAFRVIADHARACTFAIADGIRPANDGRGYVIRRILRRAARFGRRLGQHEPFMHGLVPVIVGEMGGFFPEIAQRQKVAEETVHEEEASFNRTLDRGIDLWWNFAGQALRAAFDAGQKQFAHDFQYSIGFSGHVGTSGAAIGPTTTVTIDRPNRDNPIMRFPLGALSSERVKDLCKGATPEISADGAFLLYDTYGFPLDLTELMAGEVGMTVDKSGFEELLEEARRRSRGVSQVSVVVGLPETDDSAKYFDQPVQAKVLGWVIGDKFVTDGSLAAGAEAALVLDCTGFYGEQGGQVGDSGAIESAGGAFTVRDARLAGHCVLHVGVMARGFLRSRQHVTAKVGPKRADTRRNHTATHLLNWALRKMLGEHIEQAGSVVDAEKLRFDFTHPRALSAEELRQVETLVNERILADEPVCVSSMPLAEARKIPGVRAVFGEKYPDPVRVVSVGAADPSGAGERPSAEFCGGTHLARTSQAGLFKIVAEESVAKGVRRITAVTGHEAVRHMQTLDDAVKAVTQALRAGIEQVPERLAAMQAELKQLRKQRESGPAGGMEIDHELATPGGRVVIGRVATADAAAIRNQCDQQRQKGAAAVLAGGAEEGKVTIIAMVSDELAKAGVVKAGDWVKVVAAAVGGSGGGKPTLAQAGGKDPSKLPAALAAGKAWIEERLAGKP